MLMDFGGSYAEGIREASMVKPSLPADRPGSKILQNVPEKGPADN
jgi:hypothetical protein